MPLKGCFSQRLQWIRPGKNCVKVGARRDPTGLLVEVETELEQIIIVEVIPGHA